MPSRYDIAKRLYDRGQVGGNVAATASSGGISGNSSPSLAMRYGTATEDSADGWVMVRLDTSGMSGDAAQDVRCSCDSPIYEGQRVSVLFTSAGNLKAIPIGENIKDKAVGDATKDMVKEVAIEYAAGADDVTPPSSGWSVAYPTTADYVWQRTVVTYGDGTSIISTPVCVAKPPEGYDNDATYYATSSSSATTSAKTATVQSGGDFSLKEGATVSVTFTYGNTASSPTLNVGGTGARGIRTNGTPYAYWSAGASVLFVYDGTYWQVASTPVYASTTTVGNPAAKNVYIDGEGVAIRNGTTDYSTFEVDEIHLGLNASTDAKIYMFDDKIMISAEDATGPVGQDASAFKISGTPGAVDPSSMMLQLAGDTYLALTATGVGTRYKTATLQCGDSSVVVNNATINVASQSVYLGDALGKVAFPAFSIEKPSCTIGTFGSSYSMSSSNRIFTATSEFGNGTVVTGGTQIKRSGNYIQVTIPAAYGTCYVEVSGTCRVSGVNSANLAMEIHCDRYSGTGTPSVSVIYGGVVTATGTDFVCCSATPFILELPGRSAGQNVYRISMVGRTSNASGLLADWYMTAKML